MGKQEAIYLNIAHLKYFIGVAEAENISQAAREMYISQPALSRAMTRLEETLGVKLFIRESNFIKLTTAGKSFLPYAKACVVSLEDGLALAKQIDTKERNTLRIASAFGMIHSIVEEYRETHSEINIEVTTCDSDEITCMLERGEVDIGINLGSIPNAKFDNLILLENNYFIAVNNKNPLARCKSVSMARLTQEQLFCSNIAKTYEIILGLFEKSGLNCNLIKLDEGNILFDAARKGLGIVFCLPMLHETNREFRNDAEDKVIFVPISDCKGRGQVVFMTTRNHNFSLDANRFINYLTDKFIKIERFTDEYTIKHGVSISP